MCNQVSYNPLAVMSTLFARLTMKRSFRSTVESIAHTGPLVSGQHSRLWIQRSELKSRWVLCFVTLLKAKWETSSRHSLELLHGTIEAELSSPASKAGDDDKTDGTRPCYFASLYWNRKDWFNPKQCGWAHGRLKWRWFAPATIDNDLENVGRVFIIIAKGKIRTLDW